MNKSPIQQNYLLSTIVVIALFLFSIPAFAQPIITDITPNTVAQGQTINAVVRGSGLNENISTIGIAGGGVTAIVLNTSSDGSSLTIQLIASPSSDTVQKSFFIGTFDNQQATFPIQVIPADAPTVDFMFPNNGKPGETKFVQVVGMGLTNISSVQTSNNTDLIINSYRYYPHGSILDLSVSINPEAVTPASHELYIETSTGQQAKVYFNVVSTSYNTTDNSSYSDPFSPGIFNIEFSPFNKGQIILKGTMFNPSIQNNIVTLLENNNGEVISRQINVNYASDNELIIDLPENINTSEISLAVSTDGKSSNIKTIDLNTLLDSSNTATDPQINGTVSPTLTTTNNQYNNNDLLAIAPSNDLAVNSTPDDIPEISVPIPDSLKDTSIPQNIQPLTQYLFSDSNEILEERINEASLKDISDPTKLISTIEENKNMKKQSDLIMIALEEAKKDKDFQDTLKKAEGLKSQVDELEKLLEEEKVKNKPDRRKLTQYKQLLASANAESKSQTFALLNNLLKYKPQLKNQLIQKPFDLAAIQPNIPENSVVLQYVPTEEGLIIFVVDNKNLKTRVNKSVSREILNVEVKAFRQLLEKEIDKIAQSGRSTPITTWKRNKTKIYKEEILPIKERSIFLYQALIEPVEKDIAGKDVLAIISNGWLRYVPFQALGKLTKDGDVNFLISEKSIVYLDSVLALSKNESNPISSMATVAVLANPDGTLAGANKEAEIISKLFTMSTTTLVQQSFTKDTINQLSKKSDIIHLATHGYFDSLDFGASYLVTGKETNPKNQKSTVQKLQLKDIYDLNLKNSKLIVLSGCDTGKIGNLDDEPDDIVGSLATAFRVAGANTILASLWKAHDDATKIIMENFYKNIKNGVNKAEALRLAALQVKQDPKYGHPLFWSLFNLIGDWR